MTARPVPAVALVGAGPGDRDLVTLRAEAVLAAAHVVVADRSVAALARDLAPRAELVEVDTRHRPDLVALAAAHGPVVRCYAGDAWLHPHHADDAERLIAAGIDPETVPAVVPEWAALAAAGIAVHHRPRAVTVTVGPLTDLPPAVDPARTLVATVDDLRAAAGHLAVAGDPTMPAAVVAAARASEPISTTTGATAPSPVPTSATTDAPATSPDPGPAGARAGGAGTARRGTLAELAATAPRAPGVIVTGAVTAIGVDDPPADTTDAAVVTVAGEGTW